MLSSSSEEIAAVFDALDADLDRVCELSFDALTTPERLQILQRLETRHARCRCPAMPCSTSSPNKPADGAGEAGADGCSSFASVRVITLRVTGAALSPALRKGRCSG